jgi:hypothetical protein
MSLGSPAEIIPFTRFLECRQQLDRLGVAHDTSVTPASTDEGLQPEVTETTIGSSTHEKATLTVSSVTMIAATCR